MITKRPWEVFYDDRLRKIFSENKTIIDIGGGLRLLQGKGNRYNPDREWLRPFVEKVQYKIMDPIDTYEPDIVGDIHNMPFADNSLEAILCIAVLEHVENPIKSAQEMYRTLKKGGQLLIFVPFLYYYHAERGYYGDFWRFTRDSIKYIFKGFSIIEIEPVRGAIETLVRLSPLGRFSFFNDIGFWLDKVTGKSKSKQVSGYYVFLQK